MTRGRRLDTGAPAVKAELARVKRGKEARGKVASTETTFESGAKRDSTMQPCWADIPFDTLRRLALIYTEGHKRYGAKNWCKGIPYSDTVNHMLEHLYKYMSGDRTEDHLAKVAWGCFTMMWLDEHKPDSRLNDLEF